MKELINEAIMEMVNDGLFSMKRLQDLIYIKEFIDRISTKKFVEDHDLDDIANKFGVPPSVITWGDYFQTEMATALIVLSDEEFSRVVNTVKFDMMASCIIFTDKGGDFFEWVDRSSLDIIRTKERDFTEEEEEILHLKILKDYYTDLGIVDNFTAAEKKWYSAFDQAVAM